jgi:hypothetical protein
MGASGWRPIHRTREQRLDDVIAQRNWRRHCFQARGSRFITPRPTDTLDHIFCSEFFEIVGSMTRTVLGGSVAGRGTNFLFQIQPRAASINQGLKDLVHLVADLKNEVPAVFHLVIGVLVTEAASTPFFGIQSKAEAGTVNPTLADLAQSPYRLGRQSTSGIPEAFAQARTRRLKRPDNRIRCALSNVSTEPVSFCHHTRKPPAL